MKTSYRFFVIGALALVLSFPSRAVASPDAFESRDASASAVMSDLLSLVVNLVAGWGDKVGCSIDPGVCLEGADSSDLGHGIDPWG